MAQLSFYDDSIANLEDSKLKQQVFFDPKRRLKGRVRRLVKQFDGTGMEEEAAETCCDTNRSALSVVTGIDGSNGSMSLRFDATRRGRATRPASSTPLGSQRWKWQEHQQPQQQSQQCLELDILTSRGYMNSTQPVSSRDSMSCRCSPLPVKVIGPSPVLSNSRKAKVPPNSLSWTS